MARPNLRPSHRPGPEPGSPGALGGAAAPPGRGRAFPRALTGCPERRDQFLPSHEETRAVPGLCQGEKQRGRTAAWARRGRGSAPGPARVGRASPGTGGGRRGR